MIELLLGCVFFHKHFVGSNLGEEFFFFFFFRLFFQAASRSDLGVFFFFRFFSHRFFRQFQGSIWVTFFFRFPSSPPLPFFQAVSRFGLGEFFFCQVVLASNRVVLQVGHDDYALVRVVYYQGQVYRSNTSNCLMRLGNNTSRSLATRPACK